MPQRQRTQNSQSSVCFAPVRPSVCGRDVLLRYSCVLPRCQYPRNRLMRRGYNCMGPGFGTQQPIIRPLHPRANGRRLRSDCRAVSNELRSSQTFSVQR
eukprot:5873587-Prymnesium_polylepis.1